MIQGSWFENTVFQSDFIFNTNLHQTHSFYYMIFGFIVLTSGFIGLTFFSSNSLSAMIFGEILFVGLVFLFTMLSRFLGNYCGNLYSLMILTMAAMETSMGMVLILNVFNVSGSVNYVSLKQLKT